VKNYRTPRQLSDCEFTSGYPIIEQGRREARYDQGDRIMLILFVVFMIAMYLEVV
jgi:hypothetical protein